MLVLAFDTTSEQGGVGLYRDDECLALVANQGPSNLYSVTLFQMVERLFAEVKARYPGTGGPSEAPPLSLRDIELFAVANGPGSFTGIRVGLAAAQAWAKAFDRPVKGVSVLEAMVEEACPEASWAVPILDARRGEFFLSLFRRASDNAKSGFREQGEGRVMKPQGLRRYLEEFARGGLAQATLTCVVREHDRPALDFLASLTNPSPCETVPGPLVGALARLALEAARQGRVQSPAELDAYYIRRTDAEIQVQKVQIQKDKKPDQET